jgi:ABC-type transport system involved in multi-copper enzyme maturation permease subunit
MNTKNTHQFPSTFSAMKTMVLLELERTFTHHQGLIYLLAFMVFWMLLLKYAVFSQILMMMNQVAGMDDLPSMLFANFFKVAMYLLPVLSLFIAANQTGTDRERGTLRFITLYCSRDAIFFSRFMSQVIVHTILIIFAAVSTLIFGMVQGDLPLTAMSHAMVAAANLVLIILPFIALMAVLSALVKSPRQATFYAGIIWSVASGAISLLSHYVPPASVLNILVPGMQFSQLGELSGSAMFTLAYVPLFQCTVLLLLGREIMRRKSL